MRNPYEAQPPRAFWKSAVAGRDPLTIDGLWSPKFTIGKSDPVAALGSCFAQHIGRALVAEGYNWIDGEPAPRDFSPEDKVKYQYEVFSVRTGNIYTVALMRQWMQWALNAVPAPDEIWRDGDRFYDPFRPTIEPNGFCSAEELLALRQQTLGAIRSMFERCRVFIFTLGLTEAWVNRSHGYVYPMCPGASAGVFDAELHAFKNYDMFEIYRDLKDVVQLLRSFNNQAQILLTVSPTPLIATASADHVLTATIKSKSILRAVAASLVDAFDHVDYFPSYEVISSFPYRGDFYEPNLRSVSARGVAHVMKTFLQALDGRTQGAPAPVPPQPEAPSKSEVDLVCEEIILESYGR